jgi:hypothetical protein
MKALVLILSLVSIAPSFAGDRAALNEALRVLERAKTQMSKAQNLMNKANNQIAIAEDAIYEAMSAPQTEVTCSYNFAGTLITGKGATEAIAKKNYIRNCINADSMLTPHLCKIQSENYLTCF